MKIVLLIVRIFFHKKARYTHLLAFVKYNSFLRLSNLIFNEYERRSKKTNLSSRPYLLNSEPTNCCNYRCPFCPTGKGSNRPVGIARVELYEKMFREIGAYTYLVTLHGWGEPLIHKDLEKIIHLAHTYRIFTVVTTNASLLTREMSRRLIACGLDYLILSIDGMSGESYEKYRIGGRFEVILSNLKELISLKNEMHSSVPFIEWQFLVFRHNENEIESARKLATEVGVDHIVFMPAYTEDSSFDSSDSRFHLPKASPLSKRSDCKHLWSTLTVHWDGAVVPCCYDYYGEIPYGNLLTDDVDQVWNNQKFQESRMIVRSEHEYGSTNLYCNSCVRNINQSQVSKLYT